MSAPSTSALVGFSSPAASCSFATSRRRSTAKIWYAERARLRAGRSAALVGSAAAFFFGSAFFFCGTHSSHLAAAAAAAPGGGGRASCSSRSSAPSAGAPASRRAIHSQPSRWCGSIASAIAGGGGSCAPRGAQLPPPPAIALAMLPHQREGWEWMARREAGAPALGALLRDEQLARPPPPGAAAAAAAKCEECVPQKKKAEPKKKAAAEPTKAAERPARKRARSAYQIFAVERRREVAKEQEAAGDEKPTKAEVDGALKADGPFLHQVE